MMQEGEQKRRKTRIGDTGEDADGISQEQVDQMFLFTQKRFRKFEPIGLKRDVVLYDFQKEALGWMLSREMFDAHSLDIVDNDNNIFRSKNDVSVSLDIPQNAPPMTTRYSVLGGILADEMGLGKTIQLVSLIAANPRPRGLLGTLIVMPPILLTQWSNEIRTFSNLSVYKMHGAQYSTSEDNFKTFDVIMTTYDTLTSNLEKILDYDWWRVIIDEAHIIRNETTSAESVFRLKAARRWAVTGTPLQNKWHDLFALFRFLHVKPYGTYDGWMRLIEKPLTSRPGKRNLFGNYYDQAFSRLRTLMGEMMIHRTKTQINPAPTLTEKAVILDSDGGKELVVTRMETSRFYAGDGFSEKPFDYVEGYTLMDKLVKIPEKTIKFISVTMSDRERRVYEEKVKSSQQTPLTLVNKLRELAIHPDLREYKEGVPEDVYVSSKFKYVLENMEGQLEMDPGVKFLLFSPWTEVLDLFQVALHKRGWISESEWEGSKSESKGFTRAYVRIDGNIGDRQRAIAAHSFQSKEHVKLILLSIGAAGVGLNLSRGSVVYFLGPEFNPGVMNQAIDRAHRIGQMRPVQVFIYIAPNTIEKKMIDVLNIKDAMKKSILAPQLSEERLAKILTQ